MEPFISPDGHYLFFNNENDPRMNTNLHFAERTGKLTFRYLGELPGVNSDVLDAVPSVDTAGHFYFTTIRDYARTMNSIYTGEFDGKRVTNVHSVPGDISPKVPGTINMDASISPDGQTLYISRAVIVPNLPAPKKSELMIARLKDGTFSIDPASAHIMKNINTGALEYAPCISKDGLELYFTRAAPGALPRIMVADYVVFLPVSGRRVDRPGALFQRHVVGQYAQRIALQQRMAEHRALNPRAWERGDGLVVLPAPFFRRHQIGKAS